MPSTSYPPYLPRAPYVLLSMLDIAVEIGCVLYCKVGLICRYLGFWLYNLGESLVRTQYH
jgi:hypothetical protein